MNMTPQANLNRVKRPYLLRMDAHPQPAKPAVRGQGISPRRLRTTLLDWYDRSGRDLPWRAKGGQADPYKVWLSEIMLQQTTVAAVGPYFSRFIKAFPNAVALAAAPREAVLEAWAGLGYYSRARNLHAAAQRLAGGGFPNSEEGWRVLPGVGPYTAAAIAAIAHGQPANVVDGNVERVIARLFAVEAEMPTARPRLRDLAATLVAADRPGDYAQALMDLGATVCTPTQPKCLLCPWRPSCAAARRGDPESFPRRAPKAAKPRRHGAAFRLERGGDVFLVRRPDKGLLGGMLGLPTTPWRTEVWTQAEAMAHAPAPAGWKRAGAVRHVFTHFALTLDVWRAPVGKEPGLAGVWAARTELGALPTLFRKAAALHEGG
jgi:A/G-specific adenine glycosylase